LAIRKFCWGLKQAEPAMWVLMEGREEEEQKVQEVCLIADLVPWLGNEEMMEVDVI